VRPYHVLIVLIKEITFHGTYKTFSDSSLFKKTGKGPFKLLFDKSLKMNNLYAQLQFWIHNTERKKSFDWMDTDMFGMAVNKW
jgi:hypothetical protein